MSKETERLVEHMITQEFGDGGTWGGNRTDAIYLIASLPKGDREQFCADFLVAFEKQFKAEMDRLHPDSKKDRAKLSKAFAKFNPKFGGGFHPGDQI